MKRLSKIKRKECDKVEEKNARELSPKKRPDMLDLDKAIEEFKTAEEYKFIYLIYAYNKTSRYFTPYSFKTVSFKNINKICYFTLSNEGIMYHMQNEINFTPFQQFEEEYRCYQQIVKLDTFRNYLLWKYFYVWHKQIALDKFCKARDQIEKPLALFILCDPFRKACLRLTKAISQTAGLVMFEGSFPEAVTLKRFSQVQEKNIDSALSVLRKLRQSIKELVLTACKETLNSSRLAIDLSTEKGAGAMSKNSHEEPIGHHGHRHMPFTEQRTMAHCCQRICRFITYIDVIVQSHLHKIVQNQMTVFEAEVRKHFRRTSNGTIVDDETILNPLQKSSDDPKASLLVLEAILTDDSIGVNVEPEELISYVCVLMENWKQSVVSHMPPLISDEDFDIFTRPIVCGKMCDQFCNRGPSLEFIFEVDQTLKNSADRIIHYFQMGYQIVYTYVERLEYIRAMLKEHKELDLQSIKSDTNIIHFRHMLETCMKQLADVDKMVPSQTLSVFELKLITLKDLLRPTCEALLKTIKQGIVEASIKLPLKLIKEINDTQKYLELLPVKAEDYAVYKSFLEDCPNKLDNFDKQSEYLKDIFALADEFQVTIPDDIMNNYYSFSELLNVLRSTITRIDSEQEFLTEQFVKKINTSVLRLFQDVDKINSEINEQWLTDVHSNSEEVTAFLSEMNNRLIQCREKLNLYKTYQHFFQVEVANFEILEEASESVRLRMLLWNSMDEWGGKMRLWENENFHDLNVEQINAFLAQNLKYVIEFKNGLPDCELVNEIQKKVHAFKDIMPTITTLRNPNLRKQHWYKIEQILGLKFQKNQSLSLAMLEELDAFKHSCALMEISKQASSEFSLESLLEKIEQSWNGLNLIVLPYNNYSDVYILGSLEDIQLTIEEVNINLNTILASKHEGELKPKVLKWVKTMELMSNVLAEWSTCQTTWVYLESLFVTSDIQRQLPNETNIFNEVNNSWKAIMKNASKNPMTLTTCTDPKLLTSLKKNNYLLDQIMLCLDCYLESKRVVFPRFYFLSNQELLDIMTQPRNPRAVQPHMSKFFDSIWRIQFENELDESHPGENNNDINRSTNIIAMISPEKEVVKFSMDVKARGNVEFWLNRVEEAMIETLRMLMIVAMEEYDNMPRNKWALLHTGQLVLAVSQMMWCRDVHRILLEADSNFPKNLSSFEKKCADNLDDLVAMVRQHLTSLQRAVIRALITSKVHTRDIITSMVRNNINSATNFEWLKQLRYYWDEIDSCVVQMANTRWSYAFEYLGCSSRLVITPLTDKCYLCLMGALQLNLGGASVGLADTGKTETTKDLAKALATRCVVFNCSDGLDYKMMGKLFAGLAQSGAWCCFDELNRIDTEVLSVISQQLITITNAKCKNAKRFIFEGREIKLVNTCAIFITMNFGNFGGNELPNNLQALFRPITMMIPDYRLIAEVFLYSEGFESSKTLARKIASMIKLCDEQLSIQDHYNFGMRSVKSMLTMAGYLKQQNPTTDENLIVIKALINNNKPKFLNDDYTLFQTILNDLFPGIALPKEDYGQFVCNVQRIMKMHGYQTEEFSCIKIVQLLETIRVRHGIMTVGPTGGGKTTILKILAKTLTEPNRNDLNEQYCRPVNIFTINPKAITIHELYGEVNLNTMEWRDGVLGKIVRSTVQTTNEEFQWIVCDGPVDPVWMENLNTVLDDNKILCLANSERIKLTPWVRMIFEVDDLSQASPSTVSRCGMVFVDPSELGWLPYVRSWINKKNNDVLLENQEYRSYLMSLIESYVNDGFTFIDENCSSIILQTKMSKAVMMCALLESFLTKPEAISKELENSDVQKYICQSFVFAYLWALGSNLIDSSQILFDSFVFNQFEDNSNFAISPGTELRNVYLNIEQNKLENWSDIVPDFVYDRKTPFFELFVPTVDSVRYLYISQKLVQTNQPVMLSGVTGVGKTLIANCLMHNLAKSEDWTTGMIYFSAQTSSNKTQQILELKLEMKKRNVFGAPGNKRLLLVIDDVNMPIPDTYGAQPPIELLRQILDYGGLYERKQFFWKDIENVILCTICGPPGGCRNPLTPRFSRHFSIFCIPTNNEKTMKTIFTSILKEFLKDFPPNIAKCSNVLVEASVEVYQRVKEVLLPTPAKAHYIFNLRDLFKTLQGILQADVITIPDLPTLYRLWYHESLRVYHDRLVCQDDKNYFQKIMQTVSRRFFDDPLFECFRTDVNNLQNPPILLFGDFMNSVCKGRRVYEEITNFDKLKSVLLESLVDFNTVYNKNLQLIFFVDAIEHTARIARILRSDRGNALLLGVSGVGKKTLTKLATHLNDYKFFQIEQTKSYDYFSFHEDLSNIYSRVGIKLEDTTILFTDSQITQEEFLEDINNILIAGEVPNLFRKDELEQTIDICRRLAIESGVVDNKEAIFNFFINRVRSKLHLVISMNPMSDVFQQKCRLFPSLINCTTVDWIDTWSTEARLSIAKINLEPFSEQNLTPNLVNVMSDMFNYMHEIVSLKAKRSVEQIRRYFYVTSSSYLEHLQLFKNMYCLQKKKIQNDSDRFSNGLKKLYETFDMVNELKNRLNVLTPALTEKTKATLKLMEDLTKEKAGVDKVREVVLTEEAAAKVKATAAREIAEDAQRDLILAMPALEAARKSLESLNKNDINELRIFSKPPKLIQNVMQSICLMLYQKTNWASAKVVLSDVNFLRTLLDYDIDNVSDKMINQLKPYIEDPDFNPQVVATQSKVAKALCMWVRAVHSYSLVYRIVEPKRKRQEEAEGELSVVLKSLKTKQKMLADIEEQLQRLEDKYDQCVTEKNDLESNINRTQSRLKHSHLLIVALGDEQRKWEKNVKTFSQQLKTLIGDIIISAGSVNYLGPFTDEYRKEITVLWLEKLDGHNILHTPNYTLKSVLIDSFEQRSWHICGLPRDSVSVDNAIIVTRSIRQPLIIDPQEQANRWIRALEVENMLKVCKSTDDNLMDIVVNGMRRGYPVLIEGLGESVDTTLKSVLENETFANDHQILDRIGDSDIQCNTSFRLYMTTKLTNPHYSPEITKHTTLVNFIMTPPGLEDYFLQEIVKIDRPEIEEKYFSSAVCINKDNNMLTKMEDETLKMLYTSEGNILDDEELINKLNNCRETSLIIAYRLVNAEETEHKIRTKRKKYRPVAKRASCLYFSANQLIQIDSMYQFSLSYLKSIFCNAICDIDKALEDDTKLPIMIDAITKRTFTIVSRGLSERYKLVFSFLLSINIALEAKKITSSERDYLLHGPTRALNEKTHKLNEAELKDQVWHSVLYLSEHFPKFKMLPENCHGRIKINLGQFEETLELGSGNSDATIEWNSVLLPFEKLMIIKTFRKDKLILAIKNYVSCEFGKMFVENPVISFHHLYNETTSTVPILCILSPGYDSLNWFKNFALTFGAGDNFHYLSLGQSQGSLAEKLIKDGREQGKWIFLQNCHLAPSWMQRLEIIIEEIIENPSSVKSEFRLFLSSLPSNDLPTCLLQNSLKVTIEPPRGFRANMKRAFDDMSKEFFEENAFGEEWKSIIYRLCFFHAIVLERRKSGMFDWNVTYAFTNDDRECSIRMLEQYCLTATELSWEAIRCLTGEIIYSGRVADVWIQRTLNNVMWHLFKLQTNECSLNSDSNSYIPNANQCKSIDDYKSFIDRLPAYDEPEVFKMHKNTMLKFQAKETQEFLDSILKVNKEFTSGSKAKPDDYIVLNCINDITGKLISFIDIKQADITLLKKDNRGRLTPLSTVLLNEVKYFNQLLQTIHISLNDLRNVIKGLEVISSRAEEIYLSVKRNKVPTSWIKKSYPSLQTLGIWVKDLIMRLDFINSWLRYGNPPSYWISGLYLPQALIAACLQEHSRKYCVQFDSLIIDFELTATILRQDEITKKNYEEYADLEKRENGIYVHGLFLDNGQIDLHSKLLVDSHPGQFYSSLPVMRLVPTIDLNTITPHYHCPLYRTINQAKVISITRLSNNFVLTVLLPTKYPESYWLLKGTALVMQVTD